MENKGQVGKVVRRDLMTPGEVADLLRVNPKTVTRWANQGKISSVRTPGGHRRFKAIEVLAIAQGRHGA